MTSAQSASAQPSPAQQPHKSFQEMVSEAIINGDLAGFKKCAVGKYDINRRILEFRELPYKRKYNPDERYVNLHGPTMTMLAILCEQDEILKYILENKNPDLSVRVDGYTALHLAAMIKDYRPLQLLIQYQWIQENINYPIELKGVSAQQGDFTTALHAAVSNHRLTNVFLLLSEFPQYKKMNGPTPGIKKEGAAPPETPAEDEALTSYATANVDQRSSAGSTPLYIATFLKDPQIVQVLLAAGADATLATAKGETPVKLAEKLKQQAEQRAAAREKSASRSRIKQKPDPIFEVYEILTNPPDDDLDTLKHKFAPELIPHVEGIGVEEEQEEEEEVKEKEKKSQKSRKKGKPAKKGNKANSKKLDQIFDALSKLTMRVERLESVGPIARPSQQVRVDAGSEETLCSNCRLAPGKACKDCHRVFCDRCFPKAKVHPCVQDQSQTT